ncbi:hypothetical protein GBA52_001031 [Prunus armeniaca]|nr:hypothetical protein GBA52_001031 [Prunus armeniaca]
MLGQPPQVLITDQCKPLQIAVSEVIPNARHCYCLWYIMQKVPEKLGGLKGYEAIKRQLHKSVYNSLKIAEFETSWAEMIKCHELGENRWLQILYEDRQMWVPVYLKDTHFFRNDPYPRKRELNCIFDGYKSHWRYILPRWRKDFKCRYLLHHGSSNIDVYNPVYWHNHLYKLAFRSRKKAQSEEHYKTTFASIGGVVKQVSSCRGYPSVT